MGPDPGKDKLNIPLNSMISEKSLRRSFWPTWTNIPVVLGWSPSITAALAWRGVRLCSHSDFKAVALISLAATWLLAWQIRWYSKTIHVYSRGQGLRRIRNEASFWTSSLLQAKPLGCFPSGATGSKECSLIWEGAEGEGASGRERSAKGNTSNAAFVVPENTTLGLEKQSGTGWPAAEHRHR